MTFIIDKNAPTPRGNGMIRRTLPVLGLVAAAISVHAMQSGSNEAFPPLETVAAAVTAPMIAREATVLHYARAQGIGDALRETTGPLPTRLEESLQGAVGIVAYLRTEATEHRIDMAYSAGYLDGMEGGWGADRLEGYLDAAFRTEIGLLELADRSTLRWAGTFGLEEGRAIVTGAMAMTVASAPFQPIWTGPIDENTEQGAAFLEVSTSVRSLLDVLDDAAYQPADLIAATTVPEDEADAEGPDLDI
jgi:hypothetical protein